MEETQLSIEMEPAQEKPVPWGIGEAIALFIASQVIALVIAIPIVVIYMFRHPGSFTLGSEPDLPGWILAIAALIGQIGTFFLLWLVLHRFHDLRFWQGIRWTGVKTFTKNAIIAGIILAFANAIVAPFFMPEDLESIPIYMMTKTWLDLLFFAAMGIAVAPLVEEVLFRGILYPSFEKKMRPGFAIVLTALFFAAPHIPQLTNFAFGVFQVGLLGILAGWFRARSGGVRDAFYCHLSYNCVLISLEILIRIFGETPV